MPGNSPFSADWHDCLRAHFAYTVRMQDVRTEHTLSAVMQEIGFSEAELRELRVRATLRMEDVPPDFVPDLQALTEQAPPEAARVFAVAAVPEALAEAVQEAAPDVEDEAAIDADDPQEDAAPPSADEPQQLSLF